MKFLKCQGIGCNARYDCDRYEPKIFIDSKKTKFYFLAKSLNIFFKNCLFFKNVK